MCILGGKWQKRVRRVVLSTASVGLSCESSTDATSSRCSGGIESTKACVLCLQCYMDCASSWLNTEQIMSKIDRANEQNRQKVRGIAAEKNKKLLEHNRLKPRTQSGFTRGAAVTQGCTSDRIPCSVWEWDCWNSGAAEIGYRRVV